MHAERGLEGRKVSRNFCDRLFVDTPHSSLSTDPTHFRQANATSDSPKLPPISRQHPDTRPTRPTPKFRKSDVLPFAFAQISFLRSRTSQTHPGDLFPSLMIDLSQYILHCSSL